MYWVSTDRQKEEKSINRLPARFTTCIKIRLDWSLSQGLSPSTLTHS